MKLLTFSALALLLIAGGASGQEATSSSLGSSASSVSGGADIATPAALKSEEEKAIESQALAFNESMQRMQKELIDADLQSDFDAIVAPYRLEAASLADRMDSFLREKSAQVTDEMTRLAEEEQNANALKWVRGLPDLVALHVRTGLEKARVETKVVQDDPGVAPVGSEPTSTRVDPSSDALGV